MDRTTVVVLALPGTQEEPYGQVMLADVLYRFDSREVCEEIIKKFHGQPIGEEGLLLQVRYADTQAQKDLKRVTTERRQFRTNEYNVGAYGGTAAIALSPPLSIRSPLQTRATQIASHIPITRASGPWKRESSTRYECSCGVDQCEC